MKAIAHKKRVHAFEGKLKDEHEKIILAYLHCCRMHWNNTTDLLHNTDKHLYR